MIAVLFARSDSVYKSMPGCDVYDAERDALTYQGGKPVIAHPPCRGWGRLRHFAKPRPGEKGLALWAIAKVRENGGILEHPAWSSLWAIGGLPAPGQRDQYSGWTLPVNQYCFGHRAEKKTFLYIVGCAPQELPGIPLVLGEPEYVVARSRGCTKRKPRPAIGKAEREHTPPLFAQWLCDVARRCAP